MRIRYTAPLGLVACLACNDRSIQAPPPQPSAVVHAAVSQDLTNELDILFMVDDSASMDPVQGNLVANFPAFIDELKNLPRGLPNIHIGITTSSNGAGRFSSQYSGGGLNCAPVYSNDPQFPFTGAGHMIYQKTFAVDTVCDTAKITGTEHYITDVPDPAVAGGRRKNYDGDITDVFRCIAQVGASGCGFEQQLESVKQTLERAKSSRAPAGLKNFLRDGALLAVVFITNEDDCSVPPNSELFDPSNASLGFATSFRCTEYGIQCNGTKVPRNATGLLSNCVSNDGATTSDPLHSLIPVSNYIQFFQGFKPTGKLIMAAVAAPAEPFQVAAGRDINPNTTGGDDIFGLQHSCVLQVGASTTFGDPPVRIKQVLDTFVDQRDPNTGQSTPNSRARFETICQPSYRSSMQVIANLIARALDPQCLANTLSKKPEFTSPIAIPADTQHGGKVLDPQKVSCSVEDIRTTDNGQGGTMQTSLGAIQPCNPDGQTMGPCWALMVDSRCSGGGARVEVCRNGFDPDRLDMGNPAPCLDGPTRAPDGTTSQVQCESFVQ